eukprot:512256-Prymnesium_polylepis.1
MCERACEELAKSLRRACEGARGACSRAAGGGRRAAMGAVGAQAYTRRQGKGLVQRARTHERGVTLAGRCDKDPRGEGGRRTEGERRKVRLEANRRAQHDCVAATRRCPPQRRAALGRCKDARKRVVPDATPRKGAECDGRRRVGVLGDGLAHLIRAPTPHLERAAARVCLLRFDAPQEARHAVQHWSEHPVERAAAARRDAEPLERAAGAQCTRRCLHRRSRA